MNELRTAARHYEVKEKMDETIISSKTLYTISFTNCNISYFKLPLARECLNSDFKSQLQDFTSDPSVFYSREILLSESKTYYVTNIFDRLITNITDKCCRSIRANTKSSYLSGRADPTVCGFTTQVSALLFLSIRYTIRDNPNLVQTFEDSIETIISTCEEYIEPRERLFLAFQAELCNYSQKKDGTLHDSAPSKLCPHAHPFDQGEIQVGIPYIYTLFDRQFVTQHHFCVFRSDDSDNCIVADSWAGLGGRRTNWTRVMNIQEFLNCMQFIETTMNLEDQQTLINIIFHVPYGHTSEYKSQSDLYRVFVYPITPDLVKRIEEGIIDLKGGGLNRR
jgi:hypothetical protein